jgi:hypothetical protein
MVQAIRDQWAIVAAVVVLVVRPDRLAARETLIGRL